jgi:hypothetical protein
LPITLLDGSSWQGFVLGFARRHANADDFRQAFRLASPGVELKRITDVETRTPFSPYDVRLYRQIFFGIRDVLAPLVRDDAARVLPLQSPVPGKACLLEICPASTLKRFHLYAP